MLLYFLLNTTCALLDLLPEGLDDQLYGLIMLGGAFAVAIF